MREMLLMQALDDSIFRKMQAYWAKFPSLLSRRTTTTEFYGRHYHHQLASASSLGPHTQSGSSSILIYISALLSALVKITHSRNECHSGECDCGANQPLPSWQCNQLLEYENEGALWQLSQHHHHTFSEMNQVQRMLHAQATTRQVKKNSSITCCE